MMHGHLIEVLAQSMAAAVISPCSCRETQRDYDKAFDKVRGFIDRFFSRLKQLNKHGNLVCGGFLGEHRCRVRVVLLPCTKDSLIGCRQGSASEMGESSAVITPKGTHATQDQLERKEPRGAGHRTSGGIAA
jgi:hypothetical protein